MRLILLMFLGIYLILPSNVYAEICFSQDEVIDIITLLDASERDINSLGTCIELVDDLYKSLENREDSINKLTRDLIAAEQKLIKNQEAVHTWRRATWYTGTLAGVLLIIQIIQIL